MNFAVSLWHLVEQDRLVRWGAYASAGLVWFALAWADSRILLGLPLLALGIWAARRVRGEQKKRTICSGGDPTDSSSGFF